MVDSFHFGSSMLPENHLVEFASVREDQMAMPCLLQPGDDHSRTASRYLRPSWREHRYAPGNGELRQSRTGPDLVVSGDAAIVLGPPEDEDEDDSDFPRLAGEDGYESDNDDGDFDDAPTAEEESDWDDERLAHRVARNELNTIDTRSTSYPWFSA